MVWAIFITYELSLIELTVGLNASLVHYAFFYLLNIGLFYFNAHVILDFAFFQTSKSILVAAIFIAIEIVFYLLIKLQCENFWNGESWLSLSFTLSHGKLWLSNIFREIFFIGFSTAYWSMLYMIRFKERNHAIEKEQLLQKSQTLELENKYITAENAYLQNQISPHLLFNSLSFIYNAIHQVSPKAGNCVMLLADIMRYSLINSEDNRTVPLLDEVAQIEKLIELSGLRHEHKIFISFQKKGRLKGIHILPLILITLVENMIKHGGVGDVTKPGKILLDSQENFLTFKTINEKRTSTLYTRTGIGLKNIEKRLANFYPGKYTLEIKDETEDFIVSISINL